MIRHRNYIKKAFFLHFEWVALLGMLMMAVAIDTTTTGPSYCMLKNLNIDFCPGCGLGRSMALAAQGSFQASFQMHPMGVIAIPTLLYRIINLLFRNYQYKMEQSHEENIRSASRT